MTYDENIKYISTEFAQAESKNWIYDSPRYRNEAIERKIPLAILSISFQAEAFKTGYMYCNEEGYQERQLREYDCEKEMIERGLIPNI